MIGKRQHSLQSLVQVSLDAQPAMSVSGREKLVSGSQVLLRALRDFNMGKLTADDTGIFMGLLNDLFPKTAEHVPRALDADFEAKVIPSGPAWLMHLASHNNL